MTISAEKLIVAKYNGDGSTTAFTFAFRAFTATDIVVSRRSTAGVESVLVLNTDYTVAINGTGIGGTVTCTRALAVGEVLAISRNVKMTQLLDLENQGAFFAEDHEGEFDKLTAISQDIAEREERTLRVDVTDSRTPGQLLSDIFTARDTAVTKASEASASAASSAASAAYAAEKVDGFDTHVTQKTTEFDSHAASKTSDFDTNASNKTTAFNTNATNKTTAFNTNATNKTSDFDSNASAKTTAFNSNASTKTTTFDANASAKTSAFDSHVTQKTNLFDGHVIDQTSGLDLHVARTAASITGVADESRLNVSKAKTWAEGVDSTLITTNTGLVIATSNTVDLATRTELEILGGTHSSKGWAQLSESAKTAAESAQSSAESASSTATTKASEAAASATSAATTVSGFDSHAAEKQTDFDTNATSKTSAFNSNASTKTSTFDSNASSKTTAFDTNATTKTSAFDSNASSKTTDFNTNAATKKAEVDALVDEAEEFADQAEEFSDKAEVWAEGTDEEVSALGGEHSAKRWAEISIVAQSDWTETQSGSTSYIRNKPVIDTETSASSTNAVTNAAVTARINEIWSWIYNQSGWSPILATASGVDLMSSTNEVILADHA